jgi:carbamoyltransferase
VGLIQKKLAELLHMKRFDNIAAATQVWFEKLLTSWVENVVKKTDVRKIACAGGDFLNVKANQSILQLDCIDDAFFCPAASDEGLAVGAALSGYAELELQNGHKPIKIPLVSNYFGSSFTNEQIKTSLSKHNLLEKAEFIEDIDSEVGELLAKSKNIIGRFSGQMEWGPRGLGNRSIIADPSNSDLVRRINKAVKMRDFWMPFGPSILASRIDDYLINGRIAPYMVLAFDTTEKRNDLIAAIHPYDFTCRPQTVNSTYNEAYEKVIQTFEAKTGNGAILNTSFNLHGDAIVWDPEAALHTFQNSDLDVLAIGNYLLKKD